MDLYDYIQAQPDLVAPLEERRRRYELAMGVVLICALIVRHREEAVALLGEHQTLSSVTRNWREHAPASPETYNDAQPES